MNTKRLTSRFRRGAAEHAATAAPVTPAPVVAPAEPAAVTEPTSEKPVDAVGAAAAPAETAPASPEGAQPKPMPARGSRLVEGERFRPARRIVDAAAAAWPSGAATRLKPAARPVAVAAAVALALGLGFLAGTHEGVGSHETAAGMRGLEGEVVRLAGELRSVKSAVDGFKGERDKARGEILTRQAQLTEKVDRLIAQDVSGRMTRLGEQVERAGREVGRIALLSERVEKLEKGPAPVPVASAPTPPSKPVAASAAPNLDVKETGSIAEPKPAPDPRKTQIEGYFVRDFEEGFALIETRAGRYVEVAVGYVVPGIGRVEAIERRGRQWVVITPKGYIGER